MLFKEVIRVKKVPGCSSSVRELLFASVAEYNRMCTSKAGTCCEQCVLLNTMPYSHLALTAHCMHLFCVRVGGLVRPPSDSSTTCFDAVMSSWRSSRVPPMMLRGTCQDRLRQCLLCSNMTKIMFPCYNRSIDLWHPVSLHPGQHGWW